MATTTGLPGPASELAQLREVRVWLAGSLRAGACAVRAYNDARYRLAAISGLPSRFEQDFPMEVDAAPDWLGDQDARRARELLGFIDGLLISAAPDNRPAGPWPARGAAPPVGDHAFMLPRVTEIRP